MSSAPPAVRVARNVAEKQRRDKLNSYISELANSVPLVANATRRLDKTSILRLSAAFLRLHDSPLRGLVHNECSEEITNGGSCGVKPKYFDCDHLNALIEAADGFVLVVNADQKIVYVSQCVEKYLGHQNIDMMGFPLLNFIHPGDTDLVVNAFDKLLYDIKLGAQISQRIQFRCRMKERTQPRTDVVTYQVVQVSGSVHVETSTPSSSSEQFSSSESSESSLETSSRKRRHDKSSPLSNRCTLFKGFVQVMPTNPTAELSLIDANQEEYVSRLSLDGTMLYADHRISMITGFMPDEVIGKSAYGFILVPDHVISLFAHKLMLSNSNGTGIIVHRLKKRTGGYVYLQSAGCLQYDRVTGQVDHFICVSRHLHEEEGDKEREKFVKKFTPHIANDSPSALYESLQMVIGPRSQTNNLSTVKSVKYASAVTGDISVPAGGQPLPSPKIVSYASSDSGISSPHSLSFPPPPTPSPLPSPITPSVPQIPHLQCLQSPTTYVPVQQVGVGSSFHPAVSPLGVSCLGPSNIVYNHNPVVSVRLPHDASSISEDGSFLNTETSLSLGPLPMGERSSLPSYDDPAITSHEFRTLLQPSHPILNQLRRHAVSSKYTMSKQAQNVMSNENQTGDTTWNFARMSQSNPGGPMTGALVFGYQQVAGVQNVPPVYPTQVVQDSNYSNNSFQLQQAQPQQQLQQIQFVNNTQPQHLMADQVQTVSYGPGQQHQQVPLLLNHNNTLAMSPPSPPGNFLQLPLSVESKRQSVSPTPSDLSISEQTVENLAFLEQYAENYAAASAGLESAEDESQEMSSHDLFLFQNNNNSSDLTSNGSNILIPESVQGIKKRKIELPDERNMSSGPS